MDGFMSWWWRLWSGSCFRFGFGFWVWGVGFGFGFGVGFEDCGV